MFECNCVHLICAPLKALPAVPSVTTHSLAMCGSQSLTRTLSEIQRDRLIDIISSNNI